MTDNKIQQVISKLEPTGYLYHDGKENHIRVLDTPHIWGQPFDRSIMERAWTRQAEFQRAIEEIIQGGTHRVDIVSLNPPDVDWLRVIIEAMDTCLSDEKGREAPTQFRFLFGVTPMKFLPGGDDLYAEAKAAIVRLVRARAHHWERLPDVWMGRFSRMRKNLIPGAGEGVVTWNHTKAIAADGCAALVGGHNLNMDLFCCYPPVHDVSVVVHGDAAEGVQQFLDRMWACNRDLLYTYKLNIVSNSKPDWQGQWTGKWEKTTGARVPDVLSRENTSAAQANIVDKHRTGTNIEDPTPERQPAECTDDLRAYAQVQEDTGSDARPRRPWKGYEGFANYRKANRVLSVGKYYAGTSQDSYQAASEVMKETLIKGAESTIRMSQMDLISIWKANWKSHTVCHWILHALLANPKLNVEIVVSPLDAGAGAGGDQYSFGSGALRTYRLMEYYMFHPHAAEKRNEPAPGVAQRALRRLKIAPLYFTDKGLPEARPGEVSEGNSYKWPDLDRDGYTGTVKQSYFPSTKELKSGQINRPLTGVARASGKIPKVSKFVPSAPGNHAKIMIIDDEAYVVGSDNLYPGSLSEFNYLVEGKDAVNDLLESYWKPLWKYSSPHAVSFVP